MNIDELKKHYQSLYDQQLIALYQKKDSLREEAIEVLRAELIQRGLTEELNAMDKSDDVAASFSEMSLEEVQYLVSARMMQGESFESIQTDLTAHGVDVKELLNQEAEGEEGVSEFVLEAKKQNLSDQEIDEAVKAKFNLNDDKVSELKSRIQSRGKGYLIIGTILLTASVILAVFSLASGRFNLRILAITALGIGLILKGKNQKKI